MRSYNKNIVFNYTDSNLSSPIHQTEGNFSAEQDEDEDSVLPSRHKSGNSGTRLARLAVLADTIKHWEDDLSHPTVAGIHDVCIICNRLVLLYNKLLFTVSVN